MIMYINLYYVDIIIVYLHNLSLCAHNPRILHYVIFVQMAVHNRSRFLEFNLCSIAKGHVIMQLQETHGAQ